MVDKWEIELQKIGFIKNKRKKLTTWIFKDYPEIEIYFDQGYLTIEDKILKTKKLIKYFFLYYFTIYCGCPGFYLFDKSSSYHKLIVKVRKSLVNDIKQRISEDIIVEEIDIDKLKNEKNDAVYVLDTKRTKKELKSKTKKC